jgi:hypothetical protein
MTYDPYRNATTPPDPYRDYRDPSGSTGAGLLLGALMLLALGGFIFFFAGSADQNVATTDMRPPITQPSTTGSAPTREPVSPIPPQPPSR